MARVREKAAALLSPRQVGIATRCGAEAVSHAMAALTKKYGHNSRYAILKIDLKNAFNLVNRNAILHAVNKHFPELYYYVELCYGRGSDPWLWFRRIMMRSMSGVQQDAIYVGGAARQPAWAPLIFSSSA